MTRRKKAAIGSALADLNEIAFALLDKANRLESAGPNDLAGDLRECAEDLLASVDEAAGVVDGRH